jgi:hypothetical protein
MSINLNNIGLISLFFISTKQKDQIKSDQSPIQFDARKPLEPFFPWILSLDKCI